MLSMSGSTSKTGIRWWPAALVALAAAVTLGWVWLPDGRDGQERVMLTFPIAFATLLLLAIWLAFFSRLPGRRRLWAIGAVLMTIAAAVATTRIRGVTGDLVPIVEWRWASREPPALTLPPFGEVPAETRVAPAAASPSAAPVEPSPNASVAAPTPVEAAALTQVASEYPQFLGAGRNGTVTGVRVGGDWAARPPRLVWRRPIGAGWSGFAVARGIAVTQEQRGNREMVAAYYLVDGSPKWSHGDEAHYQSTIAGEGPRATPTISRGRVFTLGSTGLLNCLDLETGKAIWRRDIALDNDSAPPDWGRSSSPLIVDDLVVVSAGGSSGRSLVAYHRDSGEPVWRAGDDLASYSSPVLATLAGVRQIVVLNQSSVVGHDPATGRVLWNHPWPRSAPSVAIPLVVSENRVLLSVGYGIGSQLLQISRQGDAVSQTLVWESTRLKAKFANPVVHDGFVYGLDDGVLVCLDPSNGERRWKGGRYGHGQTILVGNRLIVTTEDGDIVLVEARPDEHREIGRFTAFAQKLWNPPALAGRFLIVRTDTEAACYELAGE
jgi:outer membrane protein assembly factor BamB